MFPGLWTCSRLGSGWGPRITLSAFFQDLRPGLCLTSSACSSKVILLLTFCCRERNQSQGTPKCGCVRSKDGRWNCRLLLCPGRTYFDSQYASLYILFLLFCNPLFFFSHHPSTWWLSFHVSEYPSLFVLNGSTLLLQTDGMNYNSTCWCWWFCFLQVFGYH